MTTLTTTTLAIIVTAKGPPEQFTVEGWSVQGVPDAAGNVLRITLLEPLPDTFGIAGTSVRYRIGDGVTYSITGTIPFAVGNHDVIGLTTLENHVQISPQNSRGTPDDEWSDVKTAETLTPVVEITGTGPVLAPLFDGDDLDDRVTWGSDYLPSDATVERQMRLGAGAWVAYANVTVSTTEAWAVREVVSKDEASATFTSETLTVSAPDAPVVIGSIATGTISEGTGTGTIATASVFSGSDLSYSLIDALKGDAPDGMTINPSTGVITYDRTSLRRGLRYMRVRATNGFGSAFHDFKVFVRFEAFDYVATTLSEWNTIWANDAATLNNKVVAVDMAIADQLVVPAKSPANKITITTADHEARIDTISFTGPAGPYDLDGAVVHHAAYPADAPGRALIRSTTGNVTLNCYNCDISHNYRGGILDPGASLPEYQIGPTTTETATTTAQRFEIVRRDPDMSTGRIRATNNGTARVYFQLGDSSVVATTSSPFLEAGATSPLGSGGLSMSSETTHISILAASGSHSLTWWAEQGLVRYMAETFGFQGGAFLVGEVIGSAIHDVNNALKGRGAVVADNNDLFRVFQDAISLGGNQNPAVTQYITRNRIGQPFGAASYAENPHSDIFQMFNESAPNPATNIVFAGNIVYQQAAGQSTKAQIFMSDHPGGYRNVLAVGNAHVAANANGFLIGESASADDAIDCMIHGSTIIFAPNPSSTSNIKLFNDDDAPSYIGRSIASSFSAGIRENNVVFDGANAATLFPDLEALLAARSAHEAMPFYAATEAAGAKWAWDQGMIDFEAASAADVVVMANVPPGIAFPTVTEVAPESVQTSPWRRIKGGGGTVTPGAGIEWQSSSDDGTTIVQDWTSGAGTIAHKHLIRVRLTASDDPATLVSGTITINGFAHTFDVLTAEQAADNFVGRTTSAASMAPRTVSLTALTGGLASAPIEGDLVIVAYTYASNTIRTASITTGGYTTESISWSNDTVDCGGVIGWKFMGSTPDTEVAVGGSSVSGAASNVGVVVYRGIDPSTPIDVAIVKATGTNGRRPNPGAITPVTSGAQILVIATNGYAADDLDEITSGYLQSTTHSEAGSSGSTKNSLLVGDVTWPGSGAYDPAALSTTDTTTSDSWSAITLALRPAP